MLGDTKPQKPFPQFIDKNPRKHFHWAMFLIVSLGLAAALLITIQNFKTQEEIDSTAFNNPRLKPLREEPLVIVKPNIDIKNWKQIKSLDGKLEVFFPNNWYGQAFEREFLISNNSVTLNGPLAPGGTQLNFDKKIIPSFTPEYVKDFKTYLIWSSEDDGYKLDFTEVRIGNKIGYKTSFQEENINIIAYAIEMDNGDYVWIRYYGVPQDELVDTILSTLKFAK